MNLLGSRNLRFVCQTFAIAILFLATFGSAFAAIEVTEVMYNPISNNDDFWEWIEVRNTGGSSIDLKGYLGVQLGDNMFDPNRTDINGTVFGDFNLESPGTPITNTVIPAGGTAIIYDGFNGGSGPFSGDNFDPNGFYDAWSLDPNVTPVMPASFFPQLTNSSGNGQTVAFYAPDPNNNGTLDGIAVKDRWPTYLLDSDGDPNDPELGSFANAAFSLDFSGVTFPNSGNGRSITWNGQGSNQIGANWSTSNDGDASGAITSSLVQREVTGTEFLNSPDDLASPGIVPNTPTDPNGGLIISEILYDPGLFNNFDDIPWEWVEVYNSSTSTIDITGWVLDDFNSSSHSGANVNVDPNSSFTGEIPSGTAAVLFNDMLDPNTFLAAWDPNGAGINIIPISGWDNGMGLNNGNGGDRVGLWDDPNAYSGDHNVHANAVVSQQYGANNGYEDPSQGPSINLADLSLDASDPNFWTTSNLGDGISKNATGIPDPNSTGFVDYHPGGDQASPGTFVVFAPNDNADFNDDGIVDGLDFLVWQRNLGDVGPAFSDGDADGDGDVDGDDLAIWETQYGSPPPSTANVSAVPEPSTVLLTILALAPLGLQRRRQS